MAESTKPDLEGITVSLRVSGLSKMELDLIMLLGKRGYISDIGEEVYAKRWNGTEEIYAVTRGVRGMPYYEVARELNIPKSRLSGLAKPVEKKGYVVRLSAYTSEHMKDDLRSKQVVLTRRGTDLYTRINRLYAAIEVADSVTKVE